MKTSDRLKRIDDDLMRVAARLNELRLARRAAAQPDRATEHLIEALARVRGGLKAVRDAGYAIEVEEDDE